jgi:hypothetical protein
VKSRGTENVYHAGGPEINPPQRKKRESIIKIIFKNYKNFSGRYNMK